MRNSFLISGPTHGQMMKMIETIASAQLMGRWKNIVAEWVYTRLLIYALSIILPRILARMNGAVGILNL